MKEYRVAFPIPSSYTVGDSLTPFYVLTRKWLLGCGLGHSSLGVYSQIPLSGYDNNIVLWNINCTEEMLTLVLLKTGAILL